GEVDARVGRGLAAEPQDAGGDEQRGAEHGAGGRGPLEELTAGRGRLGRRVERLVGHGTFLSSLGWLGTGRQFAGSVLINYNSPIEWHPDSAGSSPEDPSNVRKGRAMLKHLVLALLLVVVGLRGAAAVDDWRSLITDDELNDWQGSGGGDIFRARSGTLTVDGAGQIVFASDTKPVDLRDFELRAEVLTRPGGRAGLAFHLPSSNPRSSGGVEVRLDNSYSRGPGQGLLKTGSLVWLRPVVKSTVPDGRWFSLHVTVRGRRVQVRVEKQLVMDYVQPEKVEDGPRLKQGTVGVRGHGGSGAVQIRNLQVRPLPTDKTAAAPLPKVKLDATDLRLGRLREQGFSVVDFHTRLTGGLTLDGVLGWTWRTGSGRGGTARGGRRPAGRDDRSAR